MAGPDELGNNGGPDPTGRASDEYAHESGLHVVSTVRRPGGLMSVTAVTVPRDVRVCYHLALKA